MHRKNILPVFFLTSVTSLLVFPVVLRQKLLMKNVQGGLKPEARRSECGTPALPGGELWQEGQGEFQGWIQIQITRQRQRQRPGGELWQEGPGEKSAQVRKVKEIVIYSGVCVQG